MSISYRILNSGLKIGDVISTFRAIGVEIEYVDKGDGYDFYVIGNDVYGYIRMYVDNNLVTEFHQYGFGLRPIDMLFNCFDFISFDTNDCGGGEFDDDLENLPAGEFFKKYYPHEYKIRDNLQNVEKWVEDEEPDMFSYIKSVGRTVASYRYEYAYVKQIPVADVSLDDVISYLYQQVAAYERRGYG